MLAVVERKNSPNRIYQAQGAALDLWRCRDEEIVMEGPAGTGKTRAVLEKIVFCMMKYAGSRALIVRQTRESMTESVLVTLEEDVLPQGSPVLIGPKRRFRGVYSFPNGSQLVVGGMDKPTKIMSTEYDVVGVFEATELSEESFENLTTRLRNYVIPYQQIIADCNPDIPQHWLNRRPKKTGMTRILSRHTDNPVLFDVKSNDWTDKGRQYLKKLDRLSGARRERLLKGIWAAQEGLVYENYDARIHEITRFDIPSAWRRIRVIDFGYNDPFVCQWWAINPEGDMFRYGEIYFTKRTVQEHAPQIVEFSKGETYEATICDHDLEDRKTLETFGIYSIPAYKDILRGIQAVEERLKPSPPRDEPRLYYLKDSLIEADENLVDESMPFRTEDEYGSYVWKRGKDGKVVKESPAPGNDHGQDTTRYAVAYVDNLASQKIGVTTDVVEAVY